MVSKRTRSSRNKQATESPINGREADDIANADLSERETEPDIDATGAAGAETCTETQIGRKSAVKVGRTKKRTSKVWNHFTEVHFEETIDGIAVMKKMAECNYCTEVLCAASKQGTTRLWNHYNSFHDDKKGKPCIRKIKGADWKYDEEASIRKYYLAIIMHEYPFSFSEHEYTNDFIKSLCPIFPIMGRKTARARIMDIFHDEKKKLFDYLASHNCRFSSTMDGWTSNQNKGYLVVTCHFIDDNWRLQKRIVNFMHLKGSHRGVDLSVAYMQNMGTWNLDHKLFALTLDNAAANNVCVDTIISSLKNYGSLHCGGNFFHVRCAAHIINLIARDGVATISTVIANIRALVVIIKSSPQQQESFLKYAAEFGIAERGLSLDVATRWNSTYLMLADALHFKKAFQRFVLLNSEKYGKYAPSVDDWENATVLCKCLEIFYEATKLLSGSHYPTANMFFSEFCEINLKLVEWTKSKNSFIVSMAKSMKEKFDKYWGLSNAALAVACFLDPRYKMKVVEFYYSEMSDVYGYNDMYEFKKIVQKLYDSYASMYVGPEASPMQKTQPRTARTSQCYVDLNEEPKRKRLSSFLRDNVEVGRELSDYDQYCNDPLLSWKEGDYFDILSWWKTYGVKYPILARMARDVLAIPATTVASESAFSLGGRIIHKYRSRLDPQVVEALVCTKDWVGASRQDQSGVSSILDDLADLCMNDKVEHGEGAHVDDGDTILDLEEEDS